MQAVGYNSIEAEDWEIATSGEEMSKLETLLLDKNRKMEHEVTQLKVWYLINYGRSFSSESSIIIATFIHPFLVVVSYYFPPQVKLSEKTSVLEAAEAKVSELNVKVDEQQKLIQKLEDDISKVQTLQVFYIGYQHI